MGKEDINYNSIDFDIDNPWSIKTSDSDGISEVMKKSVIQAGFEQQQRIANSNKNARQLKLERKVILENVGIISVYLSIGLLLA